MGTVLVPSCLEANYDVETGTCSQPVWIPQPSILPELTVADAQALGLAFAGLWALAFVFRRIRKFIDQI